MSDLWKYMQMQPWILIQERMLILINRKDAFGLMIYWGCIKLKAYGQWEKYVPESM